MDGMDTEVRQKNIWKNYIFDTMQQIVTMLLPLLTTPYVSRVLGADGIGVYSYTTANVTYFILIGMLGIAGYGKREIALIRDDRYAVSKLFWELNILHGMIFFLTLIPYTILIIRSDRYRVYYVINLVALIAGLIDTNWFYQAYERFKFISIRNCVVKMAIAAAIFIFVKDSEDIKVYVSLHVVGTLICNLSLWPTIHRYVDRIPLRSLNVFRHMKSVFVYFIPTIASSVYSLLDKSVINWITHSDAENGYYEQATKVLSIVHVLIQSLSTVSAAQMTILLSTDRMEEAKWRMDHSLRFMLMISMPCVWGVVGIADRFVPCFFGEGYDMVTLLLYIMMPLAVVLGFSTYLDGMYLVPSGQRERSAKAVCGGAAVNFITNIILVYFWGSAGAAIATLITEMFVAALMLWMSRPIIDSPSLIKNMMRYGSYGILIFMIARGIGRFIEDDLLCICTQISVCAVSYGIILLITNDEMLSELLNVWKKKG